MGLFKPKTWQISRFRRDVINYRDWIRTLKRERNDRNSKFNKWKLQYNSFYNVYFTHTVEETEAQLPERIMQMRLAESFAPLHRYLDEELGFAECLVPEFNQFVDEETGEPTLTYLIVYRFAFDAISVRNVIWLLIKWALLAAGIVLTFKLGLWAWLATLI